MGPMRLLPYAVARSAADGRNSGEIGQLHNPFTYEFVSHPLPTPLPTHFLDCPLESVYSPPPLGGNSPL